METKKKSPLLRLWNMGKEEHGKLILAIVLAVIGVTCSMAAYYSAAQMIIGLLHGNQNISFYLTWCAIAFAGYVIKAVLYTLALSKSHQAAFSIMKNIRIQCMHKLARVPMGNLLDVSSGQMKQLIVDQVESMETPLAHLLPEMTSNVLAPLFVFIYLLILDWRMALITLISLPIGLFFMSFMMKDYAKKYQGSVETAQKMNTAIVEYINGIEVIKAFNQGKNSYQKYADVVKANAEYFYQWMKSCQLPSSASRIVTPSTMITVLPFGLWFVMNGSLSVESFIVIMILAFGIIDPLIAAMSFTDSLAVVGTIVDLVEGLIYAPEQNHGNIPVQFEDTAITMKDVSFGYHEGQEVLHHIDLNILPNEVCAFVGPSGSGKSTITKLIAGFWDVEKGDITIGNHSLKQIPLSQLNQMIAYVSQDNYLFNDTIMENIRMGNPDADDTEVMEAAKKAGCHEFIQSLENGYQTICGSSGTHLSGGERQRIAIARAMLKEAPIIILDEATAYIDPENEAIVQKAVSSLVKDKTLIVVAHRLSTITEASKIVVVNKGRIEAIGRHEELLANNALYKQMWQAHIGTREEAL